MSLSEKQRTNIVSLLSILVGIGLIVCITFLARKEHYNVVIIEKKPEQSSRPFMDVCTEHCINNNTLNAELCPSACASGQPYIWDN